MPGCRQTRVVHLIDGELRDLVSSCLGLVGCYCYLSPQILFTREDFPTLGLLTQL